MPVPTGTDQLYLSDSRRPPFPRPAELLAHFLPMPGALRIRSIDFHDVGFLAAPHRSPPQLSQGTPPPRRRFPLASPIPSTTAQGPDMDADQFAQAPSPASRPLRF